MKLTTLNFDYSWTGLGRFAAATVDALNLDRFHLVVHDIGAPVGFELAAHDPARIITLTVLNSPVEVATFRRPLVMKPFAVKGLGELYPASDQPASISLADALARHRRPQQGDEG